MNTFRPTIRTTDMSPVVDAIAKEVKQWLNDDPEELEDTKINIAKLIKDGYASNGYEFSKEMEDMGYTPDKELVEILDSIDYEKYNCCNEAIKKWVIENNIQPKLVIGQKVKVRLREKTELLDGEIIEIDTILAQYHVYIPSEGHVKKGQLGVLASLKNFEALEAINNLTIIENEK